MAAPVSDPGVGHDLTRVADRLQIAGDDFVEPCSFRAGDLNDAVFRRGERHLGDNRRNIVRRDGLERPGGSLTIFGSTGERSCAQCDSTAHAN